jgi:hypothetical protein
MALTMLAGVVVPKLGRKNSRRSETRTGSNLLLAKDRALLPGGVSGIRPGLLHKRK